MPRIEGPHCYEMYGGAAFDEMMEAEPGTFHFTAHYKDYPCVLARIDTLHPGSFRNFLDRRFRKIAKKAAVKEYDARAVG